MSVGRLCFAMLCKFMIKKTNCRLCENENHQLVDQEIIIPLFYIPVRFPCCPR